MGQVLKNTSLYAIGEMVPRVLGFILLPIFTKYLSPSDYGILSYTTSVVAFLFVLTTLCLNSFVLRYYFEYNDAHDKKRLLGNIYIFIAFVNVSQFSVCYILGPHLLQYFDVQVPWNPYFKLALLNNFLEIFTIIPLVMFRVKQQARNFILLSISRVVLQFILVYYFVVIVDIGLIGNYYGQLIPLVIYALVSGLIIARNAIFKLDFHQIKVGLKFALPLLPGAIAYLLMSLSDRIILEQSVALASLGIYNVAVTFSQALNVIIQSAYRAIEPEIFKRYGSAEFNDFIRQVKSFFLGAVYICAIALALFIQELFYFFTSPSFYHGYKLVPLILGGVLMAAQNVIYGGMLAAEKNTKAIGFATLVGGVLSVSLNILLVPRCGVYASAIVSAIAFFVMNMLLYRLIKSEKSIRQELTSFAVYIIIVVVLLSWNPEITFINFGLKIALLTLGVVSIAGIYSFRKIYFAYVETKL